jgi:hypothetical protein
VCFNRMDTLLRPAGAWAAALDGLSMLVYQA